MANTLVSAQRVDLALARQKGQVAELRAELDARDEEIGTLLQHVRDRVVPAMSTAISYAAAGAAGALDGYLGEENKIGPVSINAAASIGFAIASVSLPDPNLAEACAAAARGIGSPLMYEFAKNQVQNHFGRDAAKQPRAPKPAIPAVNGVKKGGEPNA